MKSLIIFTAFTSGALASAVQFPPNLVNRAIDPATMNPTLFSVLSVLKTGMPTGPNVPMPTGDFEPNWYQRLPGDVKSLLPSFYPVTAAAVVATSEAPAAQLVSQVTAVESSSLVAKSEEVTGTDTVTYAPAATSTVLASSSVSPLDGASQTTSSAALASASATSSSSLSTGARFAVKTETLAVIALSGVGAAFCIFA